MRVEPFLQALTRWAAARADVVAVGIVGSHARGAARVDSDVDVVILSTRAGAMLEEDWPSVFGEVQSRTIEDYGALRSVRVFIDIDLKSSLALLDRLGQACRSTRERGRSSSMARLFSTIRSIFWRALNLPQSPYIRWSGL